MERDFEDRFNEIYREEIEPVVQKIEDARVKKLSMLVSTTIIIFLILALIGYFVMYHKGYQSQKLAIGLVTTIVFFAVISFIYMAENFGKYIKENFLKDAFIKFNKCDYLSNYSSMTGSCAGLERKFSIPYDTIKQSELFSDFTEIEGSEAFLADYKGIKYLITELKLILTRIRHSRHSTRTSRDTIFNGILLFFETKEKIKDLVVAKWAAFEDYVPGIAIISAFVIIFLTVLLKNVMGGDLSFIIFVLGTIIWFSYVLGVPIYENTKKGKLDLYEVWLNGEKTSNSSIITPSVLCLLEKFRISCRLKKIRLSVNHNGILVRLDMPKNSFELPMITLYRKFDGRRDLKKMFFELYSITKFAEEFLELEEIKSLF